MSRAEKALSWTGAVALLGLLISLVTGAIAIGRRDAAIDQLRDQKLERTEYQKDQTVLAEKLGGMAGDIRVIRAAICGKSPGACQ